ncbi:lamin tail domain-containing protein [bacterium]|nr:lamin tail domain-containing protein [bacterium]
MAKKILAIIFLMLLGGSFFVCPKMALAEEKIQFPKRDTEFLLNEAQKAITENWYDTFSDSLPEEQAALMIIRKAVRKEVFDYIGVQVPKETTIAILKVAIKLALSSDTIETLEEVINSEIKKEIGKLAEELLFKNEIKIATGELKYSKKSYRGNLQEARFQYILTYKPLDDETGEVVIEIYVPDSLEPPLSEGSVGGVGGTPWDLSQWLKQGKEKLDPFVVKIQGKIVKNWYGGYSWVEKPSIEVTFSESVPRLEFSKKPISFWGRIKGFFKGLVNKLKGLSDHFERLFSAGPVISPGQFETEELREKVQKLKEKMEATKEEYLKIKEKAEKAITEGSKEDLEHSTEELEKLIHQAEEINQELVELNDNSIGGETLREGMNDKEFQESINNEDEDNEEDAIELKKEGVAKKEKPSCALPLILISEVCAGLDKAKNEFIELYNPNDFTVSLNNENFHLKLVNSSDKITQKQITWKRNEIPPHQHFLLVGGKLIIDGQEIKADATYSSQLTRVSGVIITDGEEKILDKVAWGKEDKLPPSTAIETQGKVLTGGLKTGQSLIRLKRGNTLIDSNNNAKDFVLSNNPSPTNSLGEVRVYNPLASQGPFWGYSGNDSFSIGESTTSDISNDFIGDSNNSSESSSVTSSNFSATSSNSSVTSSNSFTTTTTTTTTTATTTTTTAAREICSLSELSRILISEVKIKGNEWIELYNPTSADIELRGCYLSYFSKTKNWNEPSRNWQFPETAKILAHDYFLISIYSSTSTTEGFKNKIDWELKTKENKPYSRGQLADSAGSIAIFSFNPVEASSSVEAEAGKIDALGWGETIVKEGNSATSTFKEKEILGRSWSTSTLNYIDTDNNQSDFSLQEPTPKERNEADTDSEDLNTESEEGNSESERELEPESELELNVELESEPELDNSESGSIISLNHLIISEIQTAGTEEFVELYNPTNYSISVDDWYLSYFSLGRDWNDPYINRPFSEAPTTTIPAKSYYLIGFGKNQSSNLDWKADNRNFNDKNGAVGIFSCNPKIATSTTTTLAEAIDKAKSCKIDIVAWGEATTTAEEEPVISASSGKSLARKIATTSDGVLTYIDSNNNKSDFEIQNPTPKALNHHFFSDLDKDGIIDSYDPETIISFNTELEAGEYTFKDLIITNNAILILNSSTTLEGFKGVKIIADNLSIDAGASISANGKGYPGDQGPGAGEKIREIRAVVDKGGGGGYGGKGGNQGSAQGGLPYGSLTEPKDLGSGGGNNGGAGGGAIIINVKDTLTLNGTISANGENGEAEYYWGRGGGSGGSIYITTNNFLGSGSITANGGNVFSNEKALGGGNRGGGGGGGRIAVYYEKNNFTGIIQADGGVGDRPGEPGTIFLKQEHLVSGSF